MSNTGSWSVKGIDNRARAVAKERAREQGVTLGDYINDMLLKGHSEAGPRDLQQRLYNEVGEQSALDQLSRKLEAIEARSTLAITGIDQSVLGLIARLENAEVSTSAVASEVDGMVDELRQTQETLRDKITVLESDDRAERNLESMRALEDALGKLADHVYEEGKLVQDQTGAITHRVETGFSDLSDRVDDMELKVESTLSEAAKRIEKSVEQAELRTEGTVRHVSERLSAIETSVASRLESVGDMGGRVDAVEADVSGALTSMDATLARIQERLNRAETTTDAALMGLERSFVSLDEQLTKVAEDADPQKIEDLRQHFESRFETLANDLRESVANARTQLANQIEAAATGENPELMGRIETTIDTLKKRLVTGEERSDRAVEAISQQMSRLSAGLDQRLQSMEAQEQAVLDKVSDQITGVAQSFEKRIEESEGRSAAAIEQVGDQVATAVNRMQAKQESALADLKTEMAESSKRSEVRLSNALSNVSDRLRQIQQQTVDHVSPVQKAMASLAARLEAVEDFTSPPGTPVQPAPQFAVPEPQSLEIEPFEAFEAETESTAEPTFETHEPEPQAPVQDFMSDLQSFDTDDVDDMSFEPQTDTIETGSEADADYAPSEAHAYVAELPEDEFDADDPFAVLGGWDDPDTELRDTEVFNADMPETAEFDVDEPFVPEGEDTAHADTALPVDNEATDYLKRAREAAIAASTDPAATKKSSRKDKSKRKAKSQDKAVAKGISARQSGRGSSSKLPIIAAASVLAIAAAGGGAYISLRGKQSPGPSPSIATLPTAQVSAPTLTEAETTEALDDMLFESDGETTEAPSASLNALKPVGIDEPQAVEVAAPVLPKIPAALTLERAAQEGNPVAQYLHGEARLADRDYVAGPDMIKRAASQGLSAAQYRLAKLHEEGLGVPRDMTAARSWTEKAAQGGNVKAMHDLAVFFADGEGGPQSYAGAAKWFRQAADFGLIDSQYNLAVLHEEGLGVSPSAQEALFWYEVALRGGDAGAKPEIDRLRQTVALSVAQSVAQRADSWTKSTPAAAANGTFTTRSWGYGARDQVFAIQTVLNGLGYEAGTPDGIAGAGTRTAIRGFQADNGLATTGEIDDRLIEALNAKIG
ncbi:MAG: peptidoglycan-binding protein [Pseudomonadota bacterium]